MNQGNWWSSTANWVKKQYFNGTHMMDLAWNNNMSQQVWIFGKHFKNNKDARIIYSTIIWFTYRQNLCFQSNLQMTSDVGWGCMLRVGQMMFAQALRLAQNSQLYHDEKTITKIISLFLKSKQQPYSIQNLVKIGYQMYQKKAGEWYSPSQMAYILKQLQKKYLIEKQKTISKSNFNKMLKIRVFDNQFELNQALTAFGCQKNASDYKNTDSQNLLIIILFRIGFKGPEQKLLKNVIHFLKQEQACIGILGGRPGKAHYIIGTTQKQFLYLDPHCVKNQMSQQSFFNQKMFSLDHNKIDPSMGLCFFVKNVKQLLNLYDRFTQVHKKKDTEIPFYSYSDGQSPDIIQIAEPTQQFSILDQQDQ